MTDPICKNCGESLFWHKEMDYSGECDNPCEEFEVDEQLQELRSEIPS